MTKPRAGVWGGTKDIPQRVRDVMDSLALNTDWTIVVEDGVEWLIARLYEDAEWGEIVAAPIKARKEWGTP